MDFIPLLKDINLKDVDFICHLDTKALKNMVQGEKC